MILTRATDAADRRVCLLDVHIVGTGLGVFCDGPAAPTAVVVDTACQAFEPIRYSRKGDSKETQDQVRAHNAAWDALCKDKNDE